MPINYELLKRLCETPGISGREETIRQVVVDELRGLVDEIEVDVLGSVVGRKSGQGRRKVMLAAHLDEIGFMVSHIDEKGFLRLQPLGGFDARVLFAQRVTVHASHGNPLRGVLSTAAKPIHLLGQDEIKVPKLSEFFVDLGLPGATVRELVEIGDPVTLERAVERVGECIIGKSMDDRVGVFVMIEAMRALRQHDVDILAVATVQEEVGLRGALTAAYRLEPDVAIALDGTLAVDTPGVPESESVSRLGQGAAIKIMDSSLICHPLLVQHFREIARRENLAHQMEILPRGGTDAGAIQRSRQGVVAMTLSIPMRYVHTVNEMVRETDVEATIALLVRYLEEAHSRDYRW